MVHGKIFYNELSNFIVVMDSNPNEVEFLNSLTATLMIVAILLLLVFRFIATYY